MAVVFISGANRGIGLALTRVYVAQGNTVVCGVRNPGDAKALNELAGNASGALEILPLNVAADASIAAAAKTMAGRPIDLLVCNAGMNDGKGGLDAASNSAAMWTNMFATNVGGAFLTARAFAENVKAAKGKIVFISSRMGSSTAAAGNSYAYRASKAAVSNIAANLAVELRPFDVAVASYHPGWVRTDMGGAGADIDVETSARGLAKRFSELSLATSGAFQNYDGAVIPY